MINMNTKNISIQQQDKWFLSYCKKNRRKIENIQFTLEMLG